MTARGAKPLIVSLALLWAVALLLTAPAAQAARSEFFGITDEPELNDQDLAALASAKVHSFRLLLRWSSVEATEGSYQWHATDQSMGRLASRGIRVARVLWGSPDWANTGGRQRPPLSATARSAWQRFLEAAVARYGPGGSYWANGYRQQFGAGATPWPVNSWEVWNEPNLKFFDPGGTVKEKVLRYGRLVQISHDAIKAKDPHARLVLAGMAPRTGSGTVDSSTFLGQLYSQLRGFGDDFDVAALHPYAPELDQVRQAIVEFRAVLTAHDDESKPLWITEFGWGSANLARPVRHVLTEGFDLILGNREAWNVQRLVWYRWRDPPPGPELKCHLCSSAGLFANDRTPKPAFDALRAFTADATAPTASITKGPGQGALTNNPTPSFAFASSEAGSTFVCRIDSGPLKQCATPFKAPTLSNGPHGFSVKAVDAAGNESATVSRSFTVDALPPAAPVITATSPASPANDGAPEVIGSAEAGSTVRVYETVGCTGGAAARGPASRFAGQGLERFGARERGHPLQGDGDGRGRERVALLGCPALRRGLRRAPDDDQRGAVGPTPESTPTFTFASSEAHSTFECRFDSDPFAACSGPGASHTPSAPLSLGPHTFEVRASDAAHNTDPTPASRTFAVVP